MTDLDRRAVLRAGGAALAITALPLPAFAAGNGMRAAMAELFGPGEIQSGGLTLSLPPLSENGYTVPMDVEVESLMTADNYVRRIAIFSERNPIPLIAVYHLTPASGRARVSGNIRLGGTQTVHAVAGMSDGSLRGVSTKTIVTLAACVIL